MKIKIILIIITILVVAFLVVRSNKESPLVSPALKQEVTQNVNVPEEVKYDNNTDLVKEVDSVNPEISENDFVIE